MGEFKDVLKAKNRMKQTDKEVATLGKAIEERGNKTIFKAPYLSDRKTGKLMVEKKTLARKAKRIQKVYKGRRNKMLRGVGGKALLAGGALYGGKILFDDYNSREKYASYPSRAGESFARLFNWTRKSNEVKASSQKAAREITKELKKLKPNKNKLGHLNAKKVKEGRTADRKRRTEIAAAIAGPTTVVGSGVYLKKQYDESHPSRVSHFVR